MEKNCHHFLSSWLVRMPVSQKNELPAMHREYSGEMYFACQSNAWCDKPSMLKWVKHVWKPCTKRFNGALAILMLDAFQVHQCEEVRQAIQDCNTIILMVPPGSTSKAQVLDVEINRPFKSHMVNCIVAHMVSQGSLNEDNIIEVSNSVDRDETYMDAVFADIAAAKDFESNKNSINNFIF
jgi:hypothetical protein